MEDGDEDYVDGLLDRDYSNDIGLVVDGGNESETNECKSTGTSEDDDSVDGSHSGNGNSDEGNGNSSDGNRSGGDGDGNGNDDDGNVNDNDGNNSNAGNGCNDYAIGIVGNGIDKEGYRGTIVRDVRDLGGPGNGPVSIETVPVAQWVVDSISCVTKKGVGGAIMVAVKLANHSGQYTLNTAQMPLSDCVIYFKNMLVAHLHSLAADRKKVIDYVESDAFDGNEYLVALIKQQKWSTRIRDCQCNHTIAAGWKSFDQPSYFHDKCRFYKTKCFGCNKRLVASAPKKDEYKVSTGVFLCVVEAMEECRSLLCALCYNSMFANEKRPSRKRSTCILYNS